VAHVACNWRISFKVKRLKVKVKVIGYVYVCLEGGLHIVSAIGAAYFCSVTVRHIQCNPDISICFPPEIIPGYL